MLLNDLGQLSPLLLPFLINKLGFDVRVHLENHIEVQVAIQHELVVHLGPISLILFELVHFSDATVTLDDQPLLVSTPAEILPQEEENDQE